MKISLFIILFVSGFFTTELLSQNNNGFWLQSAVSKTLISKKLTANFEIGTRTRSTFTRFNRFLLEPSLSYKINKRLELAGTYRYSYEQFERVNRISVATRWNKKIIKLLRLNAKITYQTEKNSSLNFWENTLRQKINLKLEIKKTKLYPFLFNEWFLSLNPNFYGFSNTRIGGGLLIKTLKRQDIKLSYFSRIDLSKSFIRHVLSITYKLDLK